MSVYLGHLKDKLFVSGMELEVGFPSFQKSGQMHKMQDKNK